MTWLAELTDFNSDCHQVCKAVDRSAAGNAAVQWAGSCAFSVRTGSGCTVAQPLANNSMLETTSKQRKRERHGVAARFKAAPPWLPKPYGINRVNTYAFNNIKETLTRSALCLVRRDGLPHHFEASCLVCTGEAGPDRCKTDGGVGD